MKANLLILTLFVLTINSGIAQTREKEIEQFVRDYSKAYENLPKTRDKKSVLEYVSPELFTTIIKSSVVDNFGLIEGTYADFDAYLDHLLTTDGLTISYEIVDIFKAQVRGNTGVVVCDVAVKVTSRGDVWNTGTEFITYTLKKFPGGWKIMHFNIVSLEEEQQKGTCLAEVFSASSGNYMVKTVVPEGSIYSTKYNSFEFNPGKDLIYINLDGVPVYSWVKGGQVTKLAQDGQSEKALGIAANEADAVFEIISVDLYPETCLVFKKKN